MTFFPGQSFPQFPSAPVTTLTQGPYGTLVKPPPQVAAGGLMPGAGAPPAAPMPMPMPTGFPAGDAPAAPPPVATAAPTAGGFGQQSPWSAALHAGMAGGQGVRDIMSSYDPSRFGNVNAQMPGSQGAAPAGGGPMSPDTTQPPAPAATPALPPVLPWLTPTTLPPAQEDPTAKAAGGPSPNLGMRLYRFASDWRNRLGYQ